MQPRPADPGVHRWLALGEEALPTEEQWLSPGEAATLAGLETIALAEGVELGHQ